MERQRIRDCIIGMLADIGELDPETLEDSTPLVGENAVIASRGLVELMLAVEEFTEDHFGAVFDWTSDAFLSARRSPVRTIATLTDYLVTLAVQDDAA